MDYINWYLNLNFLANSLSCTELIFTDKPSLIMVCGTHPSLHPNCHHQMTYCKLNLKAVYPPPPPLHTNTHTYKHTHTHTHTHTHLISLGLQKSQHHFKQKIKNQLDWLIGNLFSLTRMFWAAYWWIFFYIFSNYIPNKIVSIDEKDPPWKTKTTENKISPKKSLYKSSSFIVN